MVYEFILIMIGTFIGQEYLSVPNVKIVTQKILKTISYELEKYNSIQ